MGTPLIAFIGTLTGTVIERLQSHNLRLLVGGVLRGAGARRALLGGHATGVGLKGPLRVLRRFR